MAIINGTPGNDYLRTTRDPLDIIDGGAGNDTLIADFGRLTTGLTLVMDTTPGATTIASNGTTITNVEAIQVRGTAHDDTLGGGDGDDYLYGQGGDDSLYGGRGDDVLWGDAGDDDLDGGSGNDQLFDASGDNTLVGGDGNDTFATGDGANDIDGGAGIDVWGVGFSQLTTGITVILDTTPGAATEASNGATVRNVERINVTGTAYADTIGGGDYDDKLSGNEGDDRLLGGGGNDDLQGGIGNDTLVGGDGDDQLDGQGGDNTFLGGAGDDQIISYYYPLLGDNREPVGVDVVDGGAGTDTWYTDLRYFTSGVTIMVDSEPGATTTTSYGTTITNVEQFGIIGTWHADTLSGGDGDDGFNGSYGNDRLYGGGGNDSLLGGAGNDTLDGGDGDDRITANNYTMPSGIDVIDGGDGDDQLTADFGDLTSGLTLVLDTTPGATTTVSNGTTIRNIESLYIVGTDHDDTISGGDGNDYIYGERGDNRLDGGRGDDFLSASRGNNILNGGDGNDEISVFSGNNTLNGGDGDDRLSTRGSVDVIDGGAGNDSWQGDFQALAAPLTLDMVNEEGATTVLPDGTTIRNVESIWIGGSAHDDVIAGTNGDDLFFGWDGNDVLRGRGGSDQIIAGLGQDTLEGGAGRDRFDYRSVDFDPAQADQDTIVDFSQAEHDIIEFGLTPNRKFSFIGTDDFSGVARQVRYEISGDNTVVYGDVNGDAVSDFQIQLRGQIDLTADDFLL